MLEPQQALFIAVRKALEELYPGSVYDGAIPGPETTYPFTYLGEFNQVDRETKSVIIGYIPVTIHNWHNRTDKRGTLSARQQAVKDVLRAVSHPGHEQDHTGRYNFGPAYAWDRRGRCLFHT